MNMKQTRSNCPNGDAKMKTLFETTIRTLTAALLLNASVLTPLQAATVSSWSKVSGPGTVQFANASSPETTASFSQPGDYVLRLTASDGEYTVSDDVRVSVTAPPAPTPEPDPDSEIRLPILVYPEASIAFNLNSAPPSGSKFWMKVHNLYNENALSVRFNGGSWIKLNNSNVDVLENEFNYGGITGDFGVKRMEFSLQSGQLKSGQNTIQFSFDNTVMADRRSVGMRILDLQVYTPSDQTFIPENQLVFDYESHWKPYSTSPADIQRGRELWTSANITVVNPKGQLVSMKAKCADCHAHDGRDLKYFRYEKEVITARSQFHGLSEAQGNRIADYILSHNVKSPEKAFPWNPPYQPGPGLDDRPVEEWSAGAGLEWVLDRPEDVMDYIFPNGVRQQDIAAERKSMAREVPVALQLLDWNRWLPTEHPLDFDPTFASSDFNFRYENLRKWYSDMGGAAGHSSSVANLKWEEWNAAKYKYKSSGILRIIGDPDDENAGQHYSIGQWQVVKQWEIMKEFGLTGLNTSYKFHSPNPEPRGFPQAFLFDASPNIMKLPPLGSPLIGNGTRASFEYHNVSWYHTQLIINPGNSHAGQIRPMDWGYTYGKLKDLHYETGASVFSMAVLLFQNYMHETSSRQGLNPDGDTWYPNPGFLVLYREDPMNDATERAAFSVLMREWLEQSKRFSTSQWHAHRDVSASDTVPNHNGNAAATSVPFINNYWATVWHAKNRFNVDDQLLNDLVNWGQSIWTTQNWNALRP